VLLVVCGIFMLLMMRVLYDCTMLPMAAAADGLCFCCVKKIK